MAEKKCSYTPSAGWIFILKRILRTHSKYCTYLNDVTVRVTLTRKADISKEVGTVRPIWDPYNYRKSPPIAKVGVLLRSETQNLTLPTVEFCDNGSREGNEGISSSSKCTDSVDLRCTGVPLVQN